MDAKTSSIHRRNHGREGLRAALLVLGVAALGGCATSTTRGEGDASTGDAGPIGPGVDAFVPRVDAGPLGPTAALTAGPYPLAIGEERTECVTLDLGNPSARHVRAIRTQLSRGSHHMIIYRSRDAAASPTPTPCSPFGADGDAIYIAEAPFNELIFPEGAGLSFAAHQLIRIEIHQFNYYEEPIEVSGTVEFEFYPEGGPAPSPMELLFTGELSLSIPPRTEGHEEVSFFTVPSGARIFALTSHTHRLGTLATIHRARSETDLLELLHQSDSWADPPLDVFDPALEFGPSEGLRLMCRYTNMSSSPVGFGLSATDEMCFLWAYYY